MGDQQYPSMSGPPDDWYPHGAPQLPPAGYYNRFTIYPPSDELPPPSPFRDNDPYSAPRTTTTTTSSNSNSNHYQGPPPEAFWSPHPRHPTPFAPSPYSPPHQLQSPSAPWPHLSAGVGDPGDSSYAPPPVLRVSSGRQAFLPKRTTMPPPRSWPSPPNDNARHDHLQQPDAFEDDDYADDDHATTASLDDDKEDAAANGDDDDDAKQHLPASPAGRLAVNDFEKSSPSSQATEHTSNHNNNKKKDPLSMLAKTASNIGPPKKRLGRFDQAGSSPLSVSPIPTSTRRTVNHSNEELERQKQQRANGPKPITPGNYYSPEAADPNGTTPDNRRQPMAPPPPPQYSHRAYHANSSYRYEPWQGQPLPVCSFDSHESAQRNRGQHGAPPYYYGNGPDPYRQYPPPPPESYRGGPGPWYPPPPPPRPMPPPPSQQHHHHQQQHPHRSPPPRQQQPVTPYYQSPPQQQQPPPEPSAAAATKRKSAASGPYTQVQQQKRRGNEKHLLRKKFSWKQYPELEQFLVHHRDQYLAHSCKNYSLEQKQYNNWLTHKLIETAEASNLFFDPHEFNFVAIRDRIRCYYKSYVQTARKRGLPLPSELEKSRTVLNSKKPRLEDIETTGNDEASSDNSDRTEETNVESKKETALTPAPAKATPALPDRQMETLANETAPPTAKLSENGVVDAVAVTKLDTTSATESKDDRNEPMADLAGQPMIVTRRMATRGITRGSR